MAPSFGSEADQKTAWGAVFPANPTTSVRRLISPFRRAIGVHGGDKTSHVAGHQSSWRVCFPKRKHTNNGMLSPVDFETRQQKLNEAGV